MLQFKKKHITLAKNTGMQNHYVQISRTARYFTHGVARASTQEVWLLAHGYGQLADSFLKKFSFLSSEKYWLIAPEALSRFYIDSLTTENPRVGASWMTKESRETEIEDYIQYWKTVYAQTVQKVLEQSQRPYTRVLGFSQGCSAVCRWLLDASPVFDELVLWAGEIPKDCDLNDFAKLMKGKKLHYVYGEQDELIPRHLVDAQLALLRTHDIDFELLTYEGKHEITEAMITELVLKD